MSQRDKDENLDQRVIDGFGHKWAAFDYAETQALNVQFVVYSASIDLTQFNLATSIVADFGACSGR